MRRCRPLLGTYVEITADGAEVIEAGFAAIARVHRLMSAHEPDSELSKINRVAHSRPVEVSDELREVLERAVHWSRLSGGIFDILAGGAKSFAEGRIPRHPGQPEPEAANVAALSLSGNSVRLSAPACLDLGGVAKGFAVDRAVCAMRNAGGARGLVNAGGDLFGFGSQPWPICVVHPRTRLPLAEVEVSDEALATSALLADGSDDHLPASAKWLSVTVKAPNACDADALTKIVWAGGADACGVLERSGASALGVRPDGRVEPVTSERAAA